MKVPNNKLTIDVGEHRLTVFGIGHRTIFRYGRYPWGWEANLGLAAVRYTHVNLPPGGSG